MLQWIQMSEGEVLQSGSYQNQPHVLNQQPHTRCALDVVLWMLVRKTMLLKHAVVHTYSWLCLVMEHTVKLFEIETFHVRIVMGCEILGINDSGKETVYSPLKVFNSVRQRTEKAGIKVYKIKKKVVSNEHRRLSS